MKAHTVTRVLIGGVAAAVLAACKFRHPNASSRSKQRARSYHRSKLRRVPAWLQRTSRRRTQGALGAADRLVDEGGQMEEIRNSKRTWLR